LNIHYSSADELLYAAVHNVTN